MTSGESAWVGVEIAAVITFAAAWGWRGVVAGVLGSLVATGHHLILDAARDREIEAGWLRDAPEYRWKLYAPNGLDREPIYGVPVARKIRRGVPGGYPTEGGVR